MIRAGTTFVIVTACTFSTRRISAPTAPAVISPTTPNGRAHFWTAPIRLAERDKNHPPSSSCPWPTNLVTARTLPPSPAGLHEFDSPPAPCIMKAPKGQTAPPTTTILPPSISSARFYPRLTTETYVKTNDPWNLRWDKLLEIAQRTNEHRPVLATRIRPRHVVMRSEFPNLLERILLHTPRLLGGFNLGMVRSRFVPDQQPRGTENSSPWAAISARSQIMVAFASRASSAPNASLPEIFGSQKSISTCYIAPVDLHPGGITLKVIITTLS